MEKLRFLFLFACSLLLAIGPLNLLQVVAWGNMLSDYSKDRSLVEAAKMTLDGDHPCEMCHKIAEARSEEKQDQPQGPGQNKDQAPLRWDCLSQPSDDLEKPTWSSLPSHRAGALSLTGPGNDFARVPTPPPRSAAG